MPPPPIQLGNAASSIYFPCPKVFDVFYCHNGGHCYAQYEETASPRQYGMRQPFSRGTPSPSLKFSPACICAPNYEGLRCERQLDTSLYGFNVTGIESPEIALVTVLIITLLVLAIIGIVYFMSKKK